MYNRSMPTQADLPSAGQLLRSTILALLAAGVILLTLVLPAEYGIDPTGIGRSLGLTEMGDIKQRLAQEAAQDQAAASQTPAVQANLAANTPVPQAAPQPVVEPAPVVSAPAVNPEPVSEAVAVVSQAVVMPAAETEVAATQAEVVSEPQQTVSFSLKPSEGAEIKLQMEQGAKVYYRWHANGAKVNFDTHGDAKGKSISYEKGRGVKEDEGWLEAVFSGNHGWFWRNRTEQDVTLTLEVKGDYQGLRRVL